MLTLIDLGVFANFQKKNKKSFLKLKSPQLRVQEKRTKARLKALLVMGFHFARWAPVAARPLLQNSD